MAQQTEQTAKAIGRKLRRAMESQGLDVERLAKETGKSVGHVAAVLDGYPNSTLRPTQLDTVGEIAGALGLRLDLTVIGDPEPR